MSKSSTALALIGLIIATFVGFISKYSYQGGAALEAAYFFLFSSILIYSSVRPSIERQKTNLSICIFLITVLSWCVYTSIIGDVLPALSQAAIYIAFVTPVFYNYKFNPKNMSVLAALISTLVLVQLFFDILFPNTQLDDVLDFYSGTFLLANNKSRFLGFILPLVFFIFLKTNKPYLKALSLSAFIFGCISFYIGYSNISYVFILISTLLALIFKNYYKGILYAFVGVILTIATFEIILAAINLNPTEEALILYNTTRYLDTELGVAAVYKYGLEKLNEYFYIIGLGLGQFSTRGAQLFHTAINRDIPATMIVYGQLFKASTPYGLSSIFTLFIEGGAIGLIILYLTIKSIANHAVNFVTRYMAFYIFLMMLYSPVLFEFSELYTYFICLVIAENYAKHNRSARQMTIKSIIPKLRFRASLR